MGIKFSVWLNSRYEKLKLVDLNLTAVESLVQEIKEYIIFMGFNLVLSGKATK